VDLKTVRPLLRARRRRAHSLLIVDRFITDSAGARRRASGTVIGESALKRRLNRKTNAHAAQ